MRFRRSHLYWIDDRAPRLLLEILRTAIPELRLVEYRIEHSRSITPAVLPSMAKRCGFCVGSAEPKVMTGIAADGVARG
jgi:hypothetical protein